MRFVMDVGVGRAVETYLRQAGHEVYSVLDVNPSAPDEAILLLAEEQEAMVVTMDKDFGELVFRSRRKHAGVLLLRLEEATGAEKVDVIRQILDRHGQEIVARFCVYQNGRLRIR